MLPLNGFDVVLGLNWLQTLGSILWDFKSMRMLFVSKEQRVTLQGVQPSCNSFKGRNYVMTAIDNPLDELQILLEQYDQLFQEPKMSFSF